MSKYVNPATMKGYSHTNSHQCNDVSLFVGNKLIHNYQLTLSLMKSIHSDYTLGIAGNFCEVQNFVFYVYSNKPAKIKPTTRVY